MESSRQLTGHWTIALYKLPGGDSTCDCLLCGLCVDWSHSNLVECINEIPYSNGRFCSSRALEYIREFIISFRKLKEELRRLRKGYATSIDTSLSNLYSTRKTQWV